MRNYLPVGAAVLSGLLAVNSLSAPKIQTNLEARVSAQAQASQEDPQFTRLKNKIKVLEAELYKRNVDGDQIGKPGVDVEDTSKKIARIEANGITRFLGRFGIAKTYTVLAAFTYRDGVILKAEDNSVNLDDSYRRDGYIKLSPSKAVLSNFVRSNVEYTILGGGIVNATTLQSEFESPLPSFDEMQTTIRYISAERPKFQGIHAYSSEPSYMDFLLDNLGHRITSKCGWGGVFTGYNFSTPDKNTIRIDMASLTFGGDVGYWRSLGDFMTVKRDGIKLSLANGRDSNLSSPLECKP